MLRYSIEVCRLFVQLPQCHPDSIWDFDCLDNIADNTFHTVVRIICTALQTVFREALIICPDILLPVMLSLCGGGGEDREVTDVVILGLSEICEMVF